MKLPLRIVLAAACYLAGVFGQPVSLRAGSTAHEIDGVAIVETIPKQWTQARFAAIGASKPAPEGHVYMVIRGKVTNGATEARSLHAGYLWVEDAKGTRYRNDGAGTVIYHPEGTGISPMRLAAGETRTWVGFFPVPAGASGLKLVATDLRGGAGAERATMALPDASPGYAGPLKWAGPVASGRPPAAAVGITASDVLGVWALDEEATKAAADGTLAGVRRVTVRSDGTFATMQGVTGRWRISGGRFLITYTGSGTARSDESVTFGRQRLRWPSPASGTRFGYLAKQ